MKKILSLLIIGCLLITNFISISVMAGKPNIKLYPTNKSIEQKLKDFLDFMNKKDIINPQLSNKIKNIINSVHNYDVILPGTFIFEPCKFIDIQGLGVVDYNGTFGFLTLENGTAELDDTFNRYYINGEICAVCIFDAFEGEIIGDPEETSPLNMVGECEWFCLVELSYLLELEVGGSFNKGEPVEVTINNIKESSQVEITESVFTVYRTVLLSSKEIYEEPIQETWVIPIAGSKMWYWNQKDLDGNQVSKGYYAIAGEFIINNRIHPIVMSFEITKKCRYERNLQILFRQIFDNFPILQKILKFIL